MEAKRIVIVGATSGMGQEVSKLFIEKGWKVGVAGRRAEALAQLKSLAPEQVETEVLDVTAPDAPEHLQALIEKLGGMEIYFHSSGIGKQNRELDPSIELATVNTNGLGFTRLITAAFNYFKLHGGGQIAAISSIGGTKGLGSAPSYSATKRFQNTYLESLAQLAHMEKLPIRFTDIRPGFVDTALLAGSHSYPLLMKPQRVAKAIVKAVLRGRRKKVIDSRYAIIVFFWRLIPGWLWERLSIKTRK